MRRPHPDLCPPSHHLTPAEAPLAPQIHWFSIFNSFMMVIFLTGLVSMILLRTLRADYARYTATDDDDLEALERDMSEESGWKLVHGDVFRPPPRLPILAALVGTGVQLTLLVLCVILITIAGEIAHICRGWKVCVCMHMCASAQAACTRGFWAECSLCCGCKRVLTACAESLKCLA